MKYLTQNHRLTTRIWLIAVIFSMLFVQSMQIHVHTYTHDGGQLGHLHYDNAHSVFDFSQQSHADEVAQLDQSHSGMLSNISFSHIVAVIFATLLLMACQRRCIRLARYFLSTSLTHKCETQLRPPLRAPPAH